MHAGEAVNNLEKYREWLRVRGVESSSDAEVKRFREQIHSRPFGCLLDFLLVIWIDSRGKYGGTKGWLKAQGLLEPSDKDLTYFSRRIRKSAIWRGLTILLLVIAWFVFVSLTGLRVAWIDIAVPIAILVCGLGVSAGTKLAGRDDVARARVQSPFLR